MNPIKKVLSAKTGAEKKLQGKGRQIRANVKQSVASIKGIQSVKPLSLKGIYNKGKK